jgi:hypothetical protein
MDVRRELTQIRKHYRRYHRESGEHIVWFEALPFGDDPLTESVYNDVYDEAPAGVGGRRYTSGTVVPVLMITESEDLKRAIPEGRQPIQLVNFVASVSDVADAGVSSPWEYQMHLNDMFLYDSRYFSVASYRVRGRAKDDVMLVVEGFEVYVGQEMVNDEAAPAGFLTNNHPWPAQLPTIG